MAKAHHLVSISHTVAGPRRRHIRRVRRASKADPLAAIAKRKLLTPRKAKAEWLYLYEKALDALLARAPADGVPGAAYIAGLFADNATAERKKRYPDEDPLALEKAADAPSE